MSMYRQLWLALILSTLLSLIGGLLASTLSGRAYLQEQLRTKNADNASALALSLSQRRVDAVEIELAVAALFDSGHYASVSVVDPAGKPIAYRIKPPGAAAAPAWFMKLLPLSAAPGYAQITEGWRQVGAISLSSDDSFAYRTLWQSTIRMSAALLFAGLLGAWLGTLILRRLKKPLDEVTQQARNISERRFVTMPEPAVPELKQLASAMNSTVTRLRTMFDDEANRLEALRKQTNLDDLTGISNRNHFMAKLRAAIDAEEAGGGSLLLIRIAQLAEVNRRLGRETTDSLLRAVAKEIERFTQGIPDALAARLNGADFGVLLPGAADSIQTSNELLRAAVRAASAYFPDKVPMHMGVAGFGPGTEPGSVLAQADSALAAAENSGTENVQHAAPAAAGDTPQNAEQWVQTIQHSLQRRWVRLAAFPVADFKGMLIHRECPLRLMFGDEGEWLPAGRFMPVAERLGLAPQLDLAAISLALEDLARDPQVPGLAINLSAQSVEDEKFRSGVRTLLAAKPEAARRLWMEVSEHGAYMHFDAFKTFRRELQGSGCKLGLEHFGKQFSQIGKLHDMALDFIKVDASFVRDIESNEGNRSFLKGLTAIAHNIGMQVFAEGVASAAELGTLAELGFDGATGPAVKSV